MSVSPSFRTFVVDQLSRIQPDIRTRSMFGGVGIYAGEFFFALIDNDLVYFKADATNRDRFVACGMGPFMPGGAGGEVMQYYQVPEDVLEDPEELRAWAGESIEVARRKRTTKKKPTG
jgi:DNA transformation protein and related proteins